MTFANYVCLFFAIITAIGWKIRSSTDITDPMPWWQNYGYTFMLALAVAGSIP